MPKLTEKKREELSEIVDDVASDLAEPVDCLLFESEDWDDETQQLVCVDLTAAIEKLTRVRDLLK